MTTPEERLKALGIENPTEQQKSVITNPNNPTIQELQNLKEVLLLEKQIRDINKQTPDTNIDLFKTLLEYKDNEHKRDLEFLNQINDLRLQISELMSEGDIEDTDGEMGDLFKAFELFQKIRGQNGNTEFNQTQFYDIPAQQPNIQPVAGQPTDLKVENTHNNNMGVPKTLQENPQAQDYIRRIKNGEITEQQAFKDYNMLITMGYNLPKFTQEQFKSEFEKMKNG